ncbi:MAG TPA: TIGR03435 family protein [Terriglobales bacterium]|nr:TIGR03435 family protein [Terriglobales bacterium]
MRNALFLVPVLVSALALPSLPQTPAKPLPAFDVTSVRPFKPTGPWHRQARYDPQRLTIEGMSPMELIQEAYGVNTNQIVGLPDWASWVRNFFSVVGTTSSPTTPDTMRLMLRRLLQDRFQLQFDNVTTVQPAYGLEISPSGLKVKPLKPGESCSAANEARIKKETTGLKDYSAGYDCSTAELVKHLNMMQSLHQVELPIVDRTELTGSYPFGLWREMDDLQPMPDGRGTKIGHMESIQEAMADELGLRLVKTTAPYTVMKITRIVQPGPD